MDTPKASKLIEIAGFVITLLAAIGFVVVVLAIIIEDETGLPARTAIEQLWYGR